MATGAVESRPESRPTTSALLYVVGSFCCTFSLSSTNESFLNGPPTSAPVATLGDFFFNFNFFSKLILNLTPSGFF